jgi:hypothetical protein
MDKVELRVGVVIQIELKLGREEWSVYTISKS